MFLDVPHHRFWGTLGSDLQHDHFISIGMTIYVYRDRQGRDVGRALIDMDRQGSDPAAQTLRPDA